MDLLKKAIQMEIDAGAYYSLQAVKNKGTSIENAFSILAKEEHKHEEILRRSIDDPNIQTYENQYSENDHLFVDPGDFQIEAGFTPDQLEVYRAAMVMEQSMIKLYKDIESETSDSKELRVLNFLIHQEQRHYDLFDSLEKLVRRPVDWVEAAEFGEREDY